MPSDQGQLGPIKQPGVDANDPAFAPDREMTPELNQGEEGDIIDFMMDLVTPESAKEKANRFYREAEEEEAKRERTNEMMNRLRERRTTRQQQELAEQADLPSGGANAFSLDRAVSDILSNRNAAMTEPGT